MRRTPIPRSLALCAVLLAAHAAPRSAARATEERLSLTEQLFQRGAAARAEGRLDDARAAWTTVLERDARHLPALAGLARLEAEAGAKDLALEHAAAFLGTWRHLEDRPRELRKDAEALAALSAGLDPLAARWSALSRAHVGALLELAGERMDKGAWHAARSILAEASALDPDHPELAAGLARVQSEGGNELARADDAGGVDLFADVTPEWIAKNDPKHADWGQAWELSTEHYRVRTNAGYEALQITANAMEQMQRFYCIFHQHDGAVPKAGVHIHRDRAEYMDIGEAPVEWAGGHWNGSDVVTYDQRGGNQGSLADVLQTLFHEASHQFTDICGGSGVPAWLNEGMASFFEGTRLLSNGQVEWNLVAPGRLYPLLEDLRSPARHRLADVIEGEVDDYRVYYPWGWGIVYFLYNAEGPDGRLLYRPLLSEYFQDYEGSDHTGRLLEYFVTRAAVPGISDLEDFERALEQFVFRLEALDRGTLDAVREYAASGDRQMALGDLERAIEQYQRALARSGDQPALLMKLAGALERAGHKDRAAGTLRSWIAASQLAQTLDTRDAEVVLARIEELDGSSSKLAALRAGLAAEAVALAREYASAGLPRRALAVLRAPSTSEPPSREARELYFAIAREHSVALERWRLVFNEEDLTGFYGANDGVFAVRDGRLAADMAAGGDAAAPAGPSTGADRLGGAGAAGGGDETFAFQGLFIDAAATRDWSLECDIELGAGARMAGIAFGKKGDGLFHGVTLLPEGYLDLAAFGTNGAAVARTHVDLGSGGWQRLRVDVAGPWLTASLNGTEALRHRFSSAGALAGDFGIMAGEGHAAFRRVRLLEPDPTLPRPSPIEAAAVVTAEGEIRPPARAAPGQGSLVGLAPPKLPVERWVGTPPEGGDLDRLLGHPLVVVFWTTYQEQRVPALAGIEQFARRCAELEIPVLLVSDEPYEVLAAAAARLTVRWPLGSAPSGNALAGYGIDVKGLPCALLIDVDGMVAWEGNPDYDPKFGSYLDQPLADLIEKRQLTEARTARAELTNAQSLYAAGRLGEAAALLEAIGARKLDHPVAAQARAWLTRIGEEASKLVRDAGGLASAGRRLQAAAKLERYLAEFPAGGEHAAAEAALKAIEKDAAFKAERKLALKLAQAEEALAAGKRVEAEKHARGVLEKLLETPEAWAEARARAIADELAAGEPVDAVLETYLAAYPDVRDPRRASAKPR